MFSNGDAEEKLSLCIWAEKILSRVSYVLECSIRHAKTEVHLHTYVFGLLLGDQIQDGAVVFPGSDQGLKGCSPGWQQGLQLVMHMAVTFKGILRDFWCWHKSDKETERERDGRGERTIQEQNKYISWSCSTK